MDNSCVLLMGNIGLHLHAEDIDSLCSALKTEWRNNAAGLEIGLFTSTWIGRENFSEEVLEFALT